MNRPPHIAIVRVETVPMEMLFDFVRDVEADGLRLSVESRPDPGPMAGIEWLLLPAVFVYLGKSYTDGFLKEMGKDHYIALKGGLQSLHKKFFGPTAPAVTLFGTIGKVRPDPPFSLVFSILAEGGDGLTIKLLIARQASAAEYEATVEAFLEFVDRFHGGALDDETVESLRGARVIGRTLLVAYNAASQRIEPVDSMAKDKTHGVA